MVKLYPLVSFYDKIIIGVITPGRIIDVSLLYSLKFWAPAQKGLETFDIVVELENADDEMSIPNSIAILPLQNANEDITDTDSRQETDITLYNPPSFRFLFLEYSSSATSYMYHSHEATVKLLLCERANNIFRERV